MRKQYRKSFHGRARARMGTGGRLGRRFFMNRHPGSMRAKWMPARMRMASRHADVSAFEWAPTKAVGEVLDQDRVDDTACACARHDDGDGGAAAAEEPVRRNARRGRVDDSGGQAKRRVRQQELVVLLGDWCERGGLIHLQATATREPNWPSVLTTTSGWAEYASNSAPEMTAPPNVSVIWMLASQATLDCVYPASWCVR